ncbi:MAG: hypothetical protein JJU02_11865 [Cryomorphaceae bacterium]|nr:hypothetical protein [Cryomorphaceae bacterium]
MKTTNRFFTLAATVAVMLSACKKDDESNGPGGSSDLIELTGDLDNMVLTADKKYILKNQVFVRDGKTLTIEPGTVIFGDKRTRGTLVIDKGGSMIADGTVDKPIVFTSNQEVGVRDRGDWGGLVIIGRANVNQNNPAIEGITPEVNFGTTNSTAHDNESSGTYRYLRVEFGGIELTPNNETNSITMGGVGRGTVMEYNMVSFGGDDGFEWFGGTVDGKYFISHAMWDDDFDCDYGWSGNVQYGLVVRYPGFADQSESNAFECDNGPNDNDVQPYTTGTFSNVTVFGPIRVGDRVSNNNFAHAIDLRRRTAVTITNSVFAGYPRGIRMNQPSVYENYTLHNRGVLTNNIMVYPSAANAYRAGSGVDVSDVQAYWEANNTSTVGPQTESELSIYTNLGLNPSLFYGPGQLASAYPSNPDFSVGSGSLTTGADFSHAKFSEPNRSSFFDTNVNFIGGFGSTNWAAGWTEFDPVDRVY